MAGLAGAAIAYANSYTALKPDGWVLPLFFIIGAPLIGFCLSKLILWLVNGMLRRVNPKTVDKHARWFQFLSAAGFSYGHGMNDAQKTMGVITALLVSIGYLKDFSIPTWVVFSAHGAIALGTLCGGWRIVDTLAHKVAKKHMRPHEAFCAETSAALCIIPATLWKIPLSTTHTITGSIAGVGTAGGGLNNLYMRKLWEIFRAWILTLVVSSTLAAIFLYIFTSFGL